MPELEAMPLEDLDLYDKKLPPVPGPVPEMKEVPADEVLNDKEAETKRILAIREQLQAAQEAAAKQEVIRKKPQDVFSDSTMPRAFEVLFQKLPHYGDLEEPRYATVGSSGLDLRAAIDKPVCLATIGDHVVVPTGLAIALPEGFEGQVRPRSGLAAKHGISIINTPGTIDSDYRGEIKILLVKLTTGKFWIEPGMRIAQLVIAPVVQPQVRFVEELPQTDRGTGGFGSSGVK